MSTQTQAALRAAYELDRERKATKRRNLAAFRQMLQERYGGKPTRSEGPICIVRLTARPSDRPTAHQCLPPICDHPNVWLVNGRPSAFTSEPRLALDSPRIEEARAFAEANGLARAVPFPAAGR